tara:strand:- start:44 stop:1546 length:1503 start_codon:yes stop_codon:yes gene_type:complete
VNNIIIVGGGSAGWMTASTLLKAFPNKNISLIESPNIATVGVGESTIQGIRNWVKYIGIDEKDFIKETEGSYKLSIKFTDFYKKGESFHYPFGTPDIDNNHSLLNDWWFKKFVNPKTLNTDYADCMFPLQMAYVNNNKFNKKKTTYAYHFDATKFAIWLRDQYCMPRGIKHIKEDIKSIEQDKTGIVSLNNKHKADLFIDCTGFKSLLLGKTLNEPFESYEDLLPNNSAWATRISYKDKKKELVSYTNCTAIQNGWVWNIPLWSRIGTGYVYSDKYISDEAALKQFKQYLKRDDLNFKNIKMRVGIHKRLWVKNVCAIGLAAGFIEPLESNGLYSVHEFLFFLIRNLQREKASQWDKDNFTFQCKHLFREFAEFVALHYALSHRTDTDYWKANFNKQWEEKLINLKPSLVNGFLTAAHNRSRDYHFNHIGGLHCIAAGMNWSPTDKFALEYFNQSDIGHLQKEWRKYIQNLDKRKKKYNMQVKKENSLYSVLMKENDVNI